MKKLSNLVLIIAVASSSCATSAQYYENRVGDYQDVVCPIGYSPSNSPGVLPSTPNARRDMVCIPDGATLQTAAAPQLTPAETGKYFDQLKRRVESVWKFPEGVFGEHKVAVVFMLDRDGNLLKADILESSDARLNASAIDAMKNASPFQPMSDGFKHLANNPLRMQFTIRVATRR